METKNSIEQAQTIPEIIEKSRLRITDEFSAPPVILRIDG
jgi:hypothetical protein